MRLGWTTAGVDFPSGNAPGQGGGRARASSSGLSGSGGSSQGSKASSGGGSKLRHLDRFLSAATGIPVAQAENPEDCVVIGTSKALDMADVLQDARRRGGVFH